MSINPLTFLSQYGKIKEEAKQMEAKLEQVEATGEAAGLVKVTLNGKFELINIKIEPTAVDPRDVTMLETLIKSAFIDATQKCKNQISKELGGSNLGSLASLLKNMS